MLWQESALADIDTLKLGWIRRYGWSPSVARGGDFVDLFVSVGGRRFGGSRYIMRLRYLEDWRDAGRREDFVDAEDFEKAGREHWPRASVRGVNPGHSPMPAICLRGAFGFHSILHPAESASGTSLQRFLLELQQVVDE